MLFCVRSRWAQFILNMYTYLMYHCLVIDLENTSLRGSGVVLFDLNKIMDCLAKPDIENVNYIACIMLAEEETTKQV